MPYDQIPANVQALGRSQESTRTRNIDWAPVQGGGTSINERLDILLNESNTLADQLQDLFAALRSITIHMPERKDMPIDGGPIGSEVAQRISGITGIIIAMRIATGEVRAGLNL